MKDRLFFDTSIIAYAFDKSEPRKRAVCKDLVRRAFDGDVDGFVSNQVLAELFVVLTQKVAKPLSRERAGTIVKSFADSASWEKLDYGTGTVARTADDSVTIRNPFWDLLIAETMREGKVKKICTENVRDFQGIPWVEPVDPFMGKKSQLSQALT
jgi:predicted nucleic acid-binding protein